MCGVSLDTPHNFGVWAYVLVALGIFGGDIVSISRADTSADSGTAGIFGTLFGLFYLHRSQRDQEREKRLQYWREQVCCARRHALQHAQPLARTRSTRAWRRCGKPRAIPFFRWRTGTALETRTHRAFTRMRRMTRSKTLA